MNTAEKKALLKDYLGKIVSNKVAYINGYIVRASNFVYDDLFQDVKELDFVDAKITIKPMAFDFKTVQSSITLKVYENGKVTLIKNIKKNIQSKMKFDKLTISELKQLDRLLKKVSH